MVTFNFRSHYTGCLLSCLWLCTALTAQSGPDLANIAPPLAPFVVSPPPGSQWSMEIRRDALSSNQSTDRTRAEAHPQKLEMFIGENRVQQGIIYYNSGPTNVFYVVGKSVFQQQGGTVIMMTPSDDTSDDATGLRVRVFPGVSWLSASNYVGPEELAKTACYKFQKSQASGPPLIAWVRISDRAPERIEIGGNTFIFSSISPFRQNVILPPAYATKVEKIQTQNRALENIRALNKN
ncbi:MAG: hypothetical protein ACFUZC_10670 [Chthoniobacteraceae bacterium]